jgi:hypothetical protein
MLKKISILFITGIAVLTSGCNLQTLYNPLFSGTTYVTTTAPSGNGAGTLPVFKWQSSTDMKYQIAAVFKKAIQVDGKRIKNTNDCIAIWTTGMNGSAGNVSYSDFRVFSNGAIQSSAPANLSAGTYYWAIWGDNDQMSVTHSSSAISFNP